MNLAQVIEDLVEERGLNRDEVVAIVQEGIQAAYIKKYPGLDFSTVFNRKTGEVEVFVKKEVTSVVESDDTQISLRKARPIDPKVELGEMLAVPFEKKVGRIEILAAKQVIATKIRELEQRVIYNEFKHKEGTIVGGIIHKRERSGFSIKIGEVLGLLPFSNSIPNEALRVGGPIRVLLKEVLPLARGDFQLIFDRASADFVKKLIELEIPEVFERLVEIKKVARIAGYKTKMIVSSNSNEIDPVGTCVGVGGARIKPILKELGHEKIDLIEWSENIEELVKSSLKPAEIDKVEILLGEPGETTAIVWLAQDQRSFAIGKMGQNIALASRLTGVDVQLQDLTSSVKEEIPSFSESDDQSEEEF